MTAGQEMELNASKPVALPQLNQSLQQGVAYVMPPFTMLPCFLTTYHQLVPQLLLFVLLASLHGGRQ
jgi:hypothetical protein